MADNSQNFQVVIDMLVNDNNILARIDKETKGIENAAQHAAVSERILREEIEKVAPGLLKQADAERKATEAMKEATAQIRLQVKEIRAQAREIQARNRILLDTAQDLDRVAKPLFTGGAFIVGGILAAANKYVADSKEATTTTLAWKKAQEDLNASGQKIGAVLAKEALPILKEAAVVTSKIAGFLESHPEVAGATLKAGLIAVTLGTLGKAVAGGIRLYADFKMDAALTLQMTAAELQLKAAQTQLSAAGIQSQTGGVTKGGLGLGATSGIIAGGAAAFAIGNAASNLGARVFGFDSPQDFWQQLIGKLNGASGLGTASGGIKAPSFLGGSLENQDKAVSAFAEMQKDLNDITRNSEKERTSIIADAERDIARVTADYESKRPALVAQVNARAAQLNQDFNNFLVDKANERKSILEDSEARIVEIQQQAREKREQIEKDFQRASEEATNKRDALALVKAQRDREDALANIGADAAIKKEREETAKRLAEFDRRFALERQQRAAQLAQELAENAQKLVEFEKQHQAEIKQIRAAEKEKLEQLKASTDEERRNRREQFINQLRDLGIVLGNERQTKAQAYNAMLSDLTKFVNAAKATTASLLSAASLGTASGGVAGSSSGGSVATTSSGTASSTWQSLLSSWAGLFGAHDDGGYVGKSIARMAWNGQPEFVLNNSSVRLAEKIVGGQLNQNNVIGAMSGRGQVVWNDNRRFDGEVTQAMRRAVAKDTDMAISKFVASLA